MVTSQSVCSEIFVVCVLFFMYVFILQGGIILLYAFWRCFICIGTQRNIYIYMLFKCVYMFFSLRKEKGMLTLIISRDSKYIFGSSLPETIFYLWNIPLFPKQNGRIIKLTSILRNTHDRKGSHYSRYSEFVPLSCF